MPTEQRECSYGCSHLYDTIDMPAYLNVCFQVHITRKSFCCLMTCPVEVQAGQNLMYAQFLHTWIRRNCMASLDFSIITENVALQRYKDQNMYSTPFMEDCRYYLWWHALIWARSTFPRRMNSSQPKEQCCFTGYFYRTHLKFICGVQT